MIVHVKDDTGNDASRKLNRSNKKPMTRNINSIETKSRILVAALMVQAMETSDLESTMKNLGLPVKSPDDIKGKMKPETKASKARKANEDALIDCIENKKASVSLYFAVRSLRDQTGNQTTFFEQRLRCHRDDTAIYVVPAPAPETDTASEDSPAN